MAKPLGTESEMFYSAESSYETLEDWKEDEIDNILLSNTDLLKGQELTESDTPKTILPEVICKPDITIFCIICQAYINISQLKHHRAYHKALHDLKYTDNEKPKSTEQLLIKRNDALKELMQKTTPEKPLKPKHVEKINEAYELLKAEVEDTYEVCREVIEQVDLSCRATALTCSPPCTFAVGICSSPNSRWRSEMEDTKTYQDCFGEDPNKCYLGLFDGYHGRFSAEVAASMLHRLLLNELAKFDESVVLGRLSTLHDDEDSHCNKFVFGPDAQLDYTTSKQVFAPKEPSSQKASSHRALNIKNTRPSISLQTDDEEMIKHIIQLCEEKYERLRTEFPSKLSLKSSEPPAAVQEKPKHPYATQIAKAFDTSYHLLDILLSYGKDEWSKVRWSGTSALTVIIESTSGSEETTKTVSEKQIMSLASLETKQEELVNETAKRRQYDPPQEIGYIHLANAGDTHALLVRGNRPYRLSKDHTTHNLKEQKRIKKMGGTLSSSKVEHLVNGVLSTTRGLGNHGDPDLKNCILVEPYTASIMLDQYAQFLVLASSGIWEVFTDAEVCDLLMRMLPQNHLPRPATISSTLNLLLSETVLSIHGSEEKGMVTKKQTKLMKQEKDSNDEDMTEKKQSNIEGKGREIEADLLTEVGSKYSDEDSSSEMQDSGEMVSLPLHSNIQLEEDKSATSQQRELARTMAEHLVQAALWAGAHNNITVMVVLFSGCEL